MRFEDMLIVMIHVVAIRAVLKNYRVEFSVQGSPTTLLFPLRSLLIIANPTELYEYSGKKEDYSSNLYFANVDDPFPAPVPVYMALVANLFRFRFSFNIAILFRFSCKVISIVDHFQNCVAYCTADYRMPVAFGCLLSHWICLAS